MYVGKAINSASPDRFSGTHIPSVILHCVLQVALRRGRGADQSNHSALTIRAGHIECLVKKAHRGVPHFCASLHFLGNWFYSRPVWQGLPCPMSMSLLVAPGRATRGCRL